MLKKILVALDPDSDTQVATRYAADIAERYDAVVTGLAVVDLGSIEAGTKGGGIGSFYYAEKLREQMTAETRAKARELLDTFERSIGDSGVKHLEIVEEGVPFQRIVEDMKYHDLLVIGKEPHFFYGHPEKSTDTLARVVKNTVAPTLVVGRSYTKIKKVVAAYDGSEASSRALRGFVYTRPFGPDVSLHLINVYGKDAAESELTLKLAESFVKVHGFEPTLVNLKGGDTKKVIIEYVQSVDADLLVAGAHSVSGLKKMAFGSITEKLLSECPLPMFVDR